MKFLCIGISAFGAAAALAQDWPQWRGVNRDGKAGFQAPATWPKELNQKWTAAVGDGVSTPALVGDKLYVFSRQGGTEITRCLEASTGKEFWQDKCDAQGVSGPASGFQGPRSSPTVVQGKVVTLGVQGTLSCLEATTGKKLWRKDDLSGGVPRFYTSCSPIVWGGLVIVQLGGESDGAIVAFDLATGAEKWRWKEDGSAYSSPVLAGADGAGIVVAETAGNIVGVAAEDGKALWKMPFAVQPRSRAYNAATPIVDGSFIYFSGGGRGTKGVKMEKQGDAYSVKELWSSPDKSVQFNTPVLKDGLLYGISQTNEIFCLDAGTGQGGWSVAAPAGAPANARGPKKGMRGGGGGGYGSVVDAGSVLFALTPSSQLVVFLPGQKDFKEVAVYKVAGTPTYAHPVVSGNRVFIKDKESVTLWTVE